MNPDQSDALRRAEAVRAQRSPQQQEMEARIFVHALQGLLANPNVTGDYSDGTLGRIVERARFVANQAIVRPPG